MYYSNHRRANVEATIETQNPYRRGTTTEGKDFATVESALLWIKRKRREAKEAGLTVVWAWYRTATGDRPTDVVSRNFPVRSPIRDNPDEEREDKLDWDRSNELDSEAFAD